jgi:hypothetical protein
MVGQIVRTLLAEGRTLTACERVRELLAAQGVEETAEGLRNLLDPLRCVQAHTSQGGTAPVEVERMIADLRQQAARHDQSRQERQARIEAAWTRTQQIVAGVLQGKGLGEMRDQSDQSDQTDRADSGLSSLIPHPGEEQP